MYQESPPFLLLTGTLIIKQHPAWNYSFNYTTTNMKYIQRKIFVNGLKCHLSLKFYYFKTTENKSPSFLKHKYRWRYYFLLNIIAFILITNKDEH